jgi:hypothetical protein
MTNPDEMSSSSGPRDSKGWDGKLRVDKKAVLANPEALSDPEYSDEDAPPPEQIDADEDLLADEDGDTDVRAARNRFSGGGRHGLIYMLANRRSTSSTVELVL